MQIIAEISVYPFSQKYSALIADFVKNLKKNSAVEVTVGETSTVVRGDYDVVFSVLEMECKKALEGKDKTAIVLKILNTA